MCTLSLATEFYSAEPTHQTECPVAAQDRQVFSANGAIYFEPGASPQDSAVPKSLALKARLIGTRVGAQFGQRAQFDRLVAL